MKIVFIGIAVIICVGIAFFAYRNSQIRKTQAAVAAQVATLPPVTKDFKTPEGAILCLEDAYRRHDIEAAVASKDFVTESKIMLENLKKPDLIDQKILDETAKTLELSFRVHTKQSWPNFEGIQSFFIKREPYKDKVVVVTEACRFPDGGFSQQRLLVSETSSGWKVLNVLE